MPRRENTDIERCEYITSRYNDAVNTALGKYPDTDRIMIIDSYYVMQQDAVQKLIQDHEENPSSIMGASIWYVDRHYLGSQIGYYDTFSVPEFKNRRWPNTKSLPAGMIRTSGVGACWIFPRVLWEGSFKLMPGGLVNTPCLNTDGHEIILDCDARLWRNVESYPFWKRLVMSFGRWRNHNESFSA